MSIRRNQSGFTITELMIATSVFSVVLLLCTVGILNVGKTYYKGMITSRTQAVARSVMDNISQAIEYGGSVPIPNNSGVVVSASDDNLAFCIRDSRYTYHKNKMVDDNAGTHALILDSLGSNACVPTTNPVGGKDVRELLGDRMSLTSLQIIGEGDNYSIQLKIAFGDDTLRDPTSGNCLSQNGSQFCATAELNTTVHRRVN